MEPAGDPDVHRVWTLLSEVSEQLSQNRTASVNLHALAEGTKSQALHSQTGFVLHRFNQDKPKELYEAELERMNAAMSAENQTLLNDNRQLSALIREYELTLENVMETFRTRAHEVQQRELALMRQYENLIIKRETELTQTFLATSSARSESLARAGRMLRALMRRMSGEDIGVYEAYIAHTRTPSHAQSREPSSVSDSSTPIPLKADDKGDEASISAHTGREFIEGDKGKARDDGSQAKDEHTREEQEGDDDEEEEEEEEEEEGSPDAEGADAAQDVLVLPDRDLEIDRLLDEEDDPDKRLAAAEWSLERESELARLERENEELRALLDGLLKPPPQAASSAAQTHQATDSTSSSSAPIPIPEHPDAEHGALASDDHAPFSTLPRPSGQHRLLGGPPGSVGPFGTYKKTTVIRVDSR